MSGVDDRIVSMKFDNAAFEQKMAETLKSLDKLRQSLNFAESTRGLNELTNAGSRFHMNGVGSAVEGISAKFLALSTIGITALSNITNKAVEAGARMLKALSFGPIQEGFKEYETNMNSIQTILANTKSKGSTLDDVNGALEKLNLYSDQTIYNFSQMAKNIGTFTAAGVDLDKSVNSIKGIANLAAISGSNSDQASTAMYQLSQALAAGKVSLMDWNSVVNAGMGGEIFKKALFETGKAMKTITDVPVGASFEEWEKKGGTFREQMQKGWITADVLSTTLSSFSGDLDEATLKSMGFNDAAAKEMVALGKLGIAAATEVKTVTQLVSTVKESIASGWSQSFKIVVGDFEEAKKLFTGISNMVGKVVGNSSDARNKLLKDWKELGGRDALLDNFGEAFGVIAPILDRLGKAFREVFPPMTAQRLYDMTVAFGEFLKKLTPSMETADKLKRTFVGVFAVFEIGWTVLKEVIKLFAGLIAAVSGPAAGGILGFSANLGDMLLALNRVLVEGGAIERFFGRVKAFLMPVVGLFGQITAGIGTFFDGLQKSAPAEAALGRVEDRFGGVVDVVEKIKGFKTTVPQILKDIGDAINKWFSELGAKMAASSKPGDFDAAIDILNVGLLGGIALLIKKVIKLMKGGLDFDFGTGIISNIKGAFGELTDTLNLMQAKLKADILTKIAIAIGVLTASVLILSMIDSDKLTKALAAIAVGFGELMGAMAVLTAMSSGPKGAAKITLLVGAMIALSGAMVILAGAIKILSTIDPGDMATAMAGLAGALTIMITAMNFMSTNPAGLISGAAAMTIMSVALILFSKALKEMAEISWPEMLKGMVGIGAGLAILVIAMNLMPPNMLLTSVGMIAIAVALRILAEAVSAFGEMSWGVMLKGLLGITLALVGIGAAMWLMPPGMFLISVGLLQVAISLAAIAKVVKTMGEMKLGDLVKGLVGLAAMMTILALALNAMTGTAAGAAALLVAAGALMVLTIVLKTLAGMSIGDLVKSLVALAAIFVILGVAAAVLAPTVPALLALAVALGVLGVAMALFGAGAFMIAKAFEVMARAGVIGMKAMVEAMKIFITYLPELVKALARSLIELAAELLRAAPMLLKLVTILLVQILDTIIEVAPKIAEALAAIITSAVMLLRTKFPLIVTAAFEMLIAFLKGIRDNIGEITTLAVDILINFVDTLTNNAYRLVTAGINFLLAFLNAIRDKIGDVVTAAFDILMAFIWAVGENMWRVINLGGDIIKVLVTEIGRKAGEVATAAANTIIKFVEELGKNLGRVTTVAVDVALAFIKGITDNTQRFVNSAAQLLIDFLNGLANTIRDRSQDLRNAGGNIASAIIEGLVGGLNNGGGGPVGAALGLAGKVVGAFMGKINASSPSKLFMKIGGYITKGLAIGLNRSGDAENSAVASAERIISAFQTTLNQIPDSLEGMAELSPVITPILDLTRVQAESRNLSRLIPSSKISAGVSFGQADQIARTSELDTTSGESSTDGYDGPKEVKFEQNIYSPTALSTGEIYRNTKSQIALAKEELSIP